MNDFDYDVMQKKRIARGAYHKKGTKSKKCTLPGDFLTAAQKAKLSTTLVDVNLKKPMAYDQFKLLPTDIKREYLEFLRDECGGTQTSTAEMFEMTPQSFSRYIRLHEPTLKGVFPIGKPSADVIKQREDKWNAWLNPSAAAASPEKTPSEELIPGTETVEERHNLVFRPTPETAVEPQKIVEDEGEDDDVENKPSTPLIMREVCVKLYGAHTAETICAEIARQMGNKTATFSSVTISLKEEEV